MGTIAVTKQNFEEVKNAEKLLLLDFWAPWCGPCRMIGPVLDEISEERKELKIGKVNVDEESELAENFRVMSIPMLVFFKEGQEVKRVVGARNKAELIQMINEVEGI